MAYIDFLSSLHKSTKRDYLARVNNFDFPKAKAAKLAKKWGYDYWDGDRGVCYGGYKYIEGRWSSAAKAIIEHYKLKAGSRVLDIGCGKGFQLYELQKACPGLEIYGIDISEYAIKNAKPEIANKLVIGNATKLDWEDGYFDLAYSLTTLHNLHNFELAKALTEIERIARNKYICVESYRNEEEKANLLYWQVTCEMFCTPEEWQWWFDYSKYTGDYSFIYFES